PGGPRELNEASVSPALTTSRVALTPEALAIVAPSAVSMNTEGMVIGGETPSGPMLMRAGSPGTLLKTMAPMAPAAWALATFAWNLQVPRMISAMLPLIAAALV